LLSLYIDSTLFSESYFLLQVNGVKFNEYSSVVVSAGYDQSLRAWDCRSHSTEPIQVDSGDILCALYSISLYCLINRVAIDMQIIDTFADSVMSICLTKTEIIGGSVDGTVRTFDIRIGRFVAA